MQAINLRQFEGYWVEVDLLSKISDFSFNLFSLSSFFLDSKKFKCTDVISLKRYSESLIAILSSNKMLSYSRTPERTTCIFSTEVSNSSFVQHVYNKINNCIDTHMFVAVQCGSQVE